MRSLSAACWLALVAAPLGAQTPATNAAPACETLLTLPANELLELERLATYDLRKRESSPAFWRELGCLRVGLDAAGNKPREGALMFAGVSWRQGAVNAYLQSLRMEPTDSLTLSLLGQLVLDDWYVDSLGPIGKALLVGAQAGKADHSARKACTVSAQWAKDAPTGRGCTRMGLVGGQDSSFQYLAMSRLSAADNDTSTTTQAFDLAVAKANAPADRDAVRWHLQWFLSPEEQVAVDSADGEEFLRLVRDAVARRDVRDGRAPGARLVEHFHRLEYAEQHFPMLRPKAERERLRTLPAAIIFPDDLVDSVRVAYRGGLGKNPRLDGPSRQMDTGDLYQINDHRAHEVPALPWREYPRWQVDLDDRGVVYLRFGEPSRRIPRIGRYTMREAWLYQIDGEKLLMNFESEAFSGSLEATRLVTGVLGDYLCDLDVRRCLETQEALRNQLKPENLTTIKFQDREFLATATTKDNNSAQPEHHVRLLAYAYALWRPSTGALVTVVPYAARLSDLVALSGDSVLAPLRIEARSWDGGSGQWSDTALTRQIRKPARAGADAYITGVVTLPGTRGLSSWSITLAQGEDRGGRYYDEHHQPLSTGPLVLSDVVLGAPSQNLSWRDGELSLPFAPLQGFEATEPVALYVQVQSASAHRDGVEIEVAIATPATTTTTPRKVALTVGYRRTVEAGLTEIQQNLDVSRLGSGEYELEVVVKHAASGASDRRRATLVVR